MADFGCEDESHFTLRHNQVAQQQDDILWNLLDGSPVEWGWFVGGLAGLAAVLWAFTRFAAWVRDDEDTAATGQMMLTDINELHRGGDLSDEEYRSIKGRLMEQLEESDGSVEVSKSDDNSASQDTEASDDSEIDAEDKG